MIVPQTSDNGISRAGVGTGPNILRSPISYEQPVLDANLSTEFVQCFKKHSDRTLIIDGESGNQWTGAQLLEATSRVACNLIKQMNLGPKKNVAIICDHSDREVIFALGCFIAGCSIYPQNPEDGLEEIKTVCTMIQVDAIATQSKHHQLVSELRKHLPKQVPIIWVEEQTKGVEANNGFNEDPLDNNNCNNNNDDYEYKQDLIERDGVILMDKMVDPEAEIDEKLIEKLGKEMIKSKECPGYYMLTSGSTGYPKVVEMMQWGVINCARSMYRCSQVVGWNGQEGSSERQLPLDEESILAGDLPLDHGAGLCFVIMTLLIGSKYIVLPVGTLEQLCQKIGQYKIQVLINGSTRIFQLLKLMQQYAINNTKERSYLDSLTYVCGVGAKINFVPLIQEVESLYPNFQVTQSYGLTEVGYVATLPLSNARNDVQSVGYLFPGVIGIVVDEEGNQLGANERGELHVYSDSVFHQYLCRKGIDARQALLDCHDSKGYYNTGDLVHYDEQGRLYIHGRIKETLVLRGEWKILPAELEAIVNEHPLIEFSAIVGIPDPEVPEVQVPKAFVKLVNPNSNKYLQLIEQLSQKTLAEDEQKHLEHLVKCYKSHNYDTIAGDIFEFAKSKTAKEKHLTGGVKILEEFPMNGRLKKIDRKVLRQM